MKKKSKLVRLSDRTVAALEEMGQMIAAFERSQGREPYPSSFGYTVEVLLRSAAEGSLRGEIKAIVDRRDCKE